MLSVVEIVRYCYPNLQKKIGICMRNNDLTFRYLLSITLLRESNIKKSQSVSYKPIWNINF